VGWCSIIGMDGYLSRPGIPSRITRMVRDQVDKCLLNCARILCAKSIANHVAPRSDCCVCKAIGPKAWAIESSG
jgi:hypothetical protein